MISSRDVFDYSQTSIREYEFSGKTPLDKYQNQLAKELAHIIISSSNSSAGGASNLYQVNSATSKSSNDVNESEVQAEKCSEYLVRLVQSDEYVEGEVGKTETYLENLYSENVTRFRKAYKKTWLKLFGTNIESFKTFVNISSAINYEWLSDEADALIIAACSHKDPFVNEAAIRAMEAWEQKKHIDYFGNIRKFEIEWLTEYRESVLEYLRSLK
ncbi:hypothetical protein [Microbulbifer marinus]|uniref:Uncharacterized protein n=1 Tax=Microbulbifer marinus TaxID=658218 RepID=A0A1H3Z4M1_9GAMM|nr:hypothetical protein [Microbulbifer marinus]SEA18600.1 hypothetical protein SAMN05216562_2185 [Microbulbifer marinus]